MGNLRPLAKMLSAGMFCAGLVMVPICLLSDIEGRAAGKDQSEFLDNLFGDEPTAKIPENKPNEPQTSQEKPLFPTMDQNNTDASPAKKKPDDRTASGYKYLNLESLDFGFAIKGAPNAAFSVDVPDYWMRVDNGQPNQLTFADIDSDPPAHLSITFTGRMDEGRSSRDIVMAHAKELQSIGGAVILDQGEIHADAGKGWRVLLKVTSPSDMDVMLMDEVVALKSGGQFYQIELVAPERVWPSAGQVMPRVLSTLFIAR